MIKSSKVEPNWEEDFWTLVSEVERLKRILLKHKISFKAEIDPSMRAVITRRANRREQLNPRQSLRLQSAISNLLLKWK